MLCKDKHLGIGEWCYKGLHWRKASAYACICCPQKTDNCRRSSSQSLHHLTLGTKVQICGEIGFINCSFTILLGFFWCSFCWDSDLSFSEEWE